MTQPLEPPTVAAHVYDEAYFRRCCGGSEEWTRSGGTEFAGVYSWAAGKVGLAEGEVLLDVGTGRGEMLVVATRCGAARAVGVEYSEAAVALARETLAANEVGDRAEVLLADARRLPLPDASADVVTMLDVVEHLTPAELLHALREVRRVLRPGGRLLVHTFPSRIVYGVTYPVQRVLLPWRLLTWPADPRMPEEVAMHVNEQSVRRLRRSLEQAGFVRPQVALGEWVYTDFVPSVRARRLYRVLARFPLTRPLAVSNMFALAVADDTAGETRD